MALYIPHSIFHLARLLYVRPETFGPYYVYFVGKNSLWMLNVMVHIVATEFEAVKHHVIKIEKRGRWEREK